MSEALTVSGRFSEKPARPHQDANFFRARFSSASRMRQTHGENLSPSDQTDTSNAMFNDNNKLGACQSSHVLQSLAKI